MSTTELKPLKGISEQDPPRERIVLESRGKAQIVLRGYPRSEYHLSSGGEKNQRSCGILEEAGGMVRRCESGSEHGRICVCEVWHSGEQSAPPAGCVSG